MSADGKLKAYIDRVLNSRAREDDEKANTKAIYAELAGEGYDKTIVGKVVNHLRKDQDKVREQSELFDTYLIAYLGASHVHARVREAETSSQPERANAGDDHETHGVAKIPNSSTETAKPLGLSAVVIENDDMAAGAGSRAGGSSVVSASVVEPDAPHSEPETGAPSSPSVSEAGDRNSADSSPAAVPVVASNVTPIRTHNPATHFLSSDGLARLHGCLKPDTCGGTWRALCFGCSVQHDGPSPQNGVA